MKTPRENRRWATLILLTTAFIFPSATAGAGPLPLQPFKDDLFAYDPLTASLDGGRYLDVPYSEARDIDRRDEIPERKVKRPYVDLSPGRSEMEQLLQTSAGPARVRVVGAAVDPSVVVIFMHGRGGDRRLGMNDWTFGGNFNRLKNLVSRAGGLYFTLDGGALADADGARVAAAVQALKARYSRAPLVLACGSMGGAICWHVADDPAAAPLLAGLVLLSASNVRADFDRMHVATKGRAVPILLAQGSRDKVYPLADQKAVFEGIRRDLPDYPIRFVAFESGNHGTPIRMIDWRDTLNWILAQQGRGP